MTSLYANALATLQHWTSPDQAQESLRGLYIEHLLATEGGLAKADFPDHLTAGALVLTEDGSRVLLNLHGKAQRWFAFGGHLEESDSTLAAGALREAIEESGLTDLVIDPTPVHLSLHTVDFCSPRGPVRHFDVRFLARLGASDRPVVSDESIDVRWFDIDDLPTDETDMVDLVNLARRRLAQGRALSAANE